MRGRMLGRLSGAGRLSHWAGCGYARGMDSRQQLAFVAAAAAASSLVADGAALAPRAPGEGALTTVLDGVAEVGVAAVPLFDAEGDAETQRRRAELTERLHAYGARDVVLWAPPGARLPEDGDAAAARVAEAGREIEAGETGEVAFPVKIGIRKTGAEGSYMSVLGGLSQQWARFTNQVAGQYQLDSSAVHRLPRDAEAVTRMVDFLVLVANGLRSEGAETTVDSEDTWTVQRIVGLEEPIVLAAPPGEAVDGRAVRRRLRRGLRDASTELDAAGAAGLRVAVLASIVAQMDRELASIALRGIDPAVLAGWDCILLAADGETRALLGPTGALGAAT